MSAKAHFHVAGIPVRIEPIFWFVTAMLGFNLGEPALVVTWVGVVLVSILIHEFGHAFALKAFGQNSSIVIHGFGGLTLSQRRLSRVQSILVSLAGPFAALALLGLPAVWVERTQGRDLLFDWVGSGGGFGWYPVLEFGVYVNIWWSLANLLPIRPLDGGNVMTEIIGIDKARIASVVVAGAAAVYAFTSLDGLRFVAFFAAFLAFINYSEYRKSKRGERAPSAFDVDAPSPRGGGGVLPGHNVGPATPAPRSGGRPTGPPRRPDNEPVVHLQGGLDPQAAESFAWNLLRNGDAAGAARVLQRSTGPVGPFVIPTVHLAANGDVDPLSAAYLANPSGPSNLLPAAVAARTGTVHELVSALLDNGDAGRDAAATIQTHLHYGEHFTEAAAVGAARYDTAGRGRAQVAFDTACAHARSGDIDAAVDWLDRAVSDGFAAPGLLDGEPDLTSVRDDARWRSIRARVA